MKWPLFSTVFHSKSGHFNSKSQYLAGGGCARPARAEEVHNVDHHVDRRGFVYGGARGDAEYTPALTAQRPADSPRQAARLMSPC